MLCQHLLHSNQSTILTCHLLECWDDGGGGGEEGVVISAVAVVQPPVVKDEDEDDKLEVECKSGVEIPVLLFEFLAAAKRSLSVGGGGACIVVKQPARNSAADAGGHSAAAPLEAPLPTPPPWTEIK